MKWELRLLRKGDHIRVFRGQYYHHGVYIGNDEVVHYTSLDSDISNDSSEVIVRKTSAEFFANNTIVEVASPNFFEKLSARRRSKRVRLALNHLGEGDYNFYMNNCEDFANKVCYRRKLTSQMENDHIIPRFVKGFVRGFLKFTGLIPYLFIRPKMFFVSEKAKRDYKENRKGVILVANHTRIADYYGYLFKYMFKKVHTMVADVAYINGFVRFLINSLENIEIKRGGEANAVAIAKAVHYLGKNENVLIFPEGKLEDVTGSLEEFQTTYAYISKKTSKPIIPFYIDGRYGFFKRPTFVVGEMVEPNQVSEENHMEDIKKLNDYVVTKVREMKVMCKDHKKYSTKTIFAWKYRVLDFVRITSVPIFYMLFPVKRYFIGDKKKIKKALKYNVILAANHYGPCDPMYMYMFFYRRTKILAAGEMWNIKILAYGFNRSGVIRYRRGDNEGIDMRAFKEALDTLKGNGCLGIFPEGHIQFDKTFSPSIKEGTATLSLLTNSPIIPFVFASPFKYFKLTKVLYGDPIYPSEIDIEGLTKEEAVAKYNEIIYNRMKYLYDLSLTKRSKNFDKKNYYHEVIKEEK